MDERTRTRSARNDRLTYIGQMMNIKKAAPKWSHLSEQLTRCAVCVNNHKPGHDNRDQAGGQLSCLLGPYCAAIFIRSNVNIFLETHQGQKRMVRIFLIHARAPYFRALCSFFAMVYWLILYWSLCVPVKQCAVVPHATALMFFILWVQYRVAVILFGVLA